MVDAMTYGTIYEALRADLLNHYEKIWTTRTWSVLLAGAAAALCLQALGVRGLGEEIAWENKFLIISLIVAGSAVFNLFLWIMSINLAAGIVGIGVYLWTIEERAGLKEGWEHWLVLRGSLSKSPPSAVTQKTILRKIGVDVQFFISILCVLSTMSVCTFHPSILCLLALVTTILTTVFGAVFKYSIGNNLQEEMTMASEYFCGDVDWNLKILENPCIKLPTINHTTIQSKG